MLANGGGIHVGDDSTVTIDNSSINGNAVILNDPNGEPAGYDAGSSSGQCHSSSQQHRETTTARTRSSASTADAGPSGTALEVDGGSTISNTRITNNRTTVTAVAGAADAAGTVFTFHQTSEPVLIENSVISQNSVTAFARAGPPPSTAQDLQTKVRSNCETHESTKHRHGDWPAGAAEGGGIWNGALIPFSDGPPVELTLTNSTVSGNLLSGTSGITIRGGGLFTSFPVTLDNSRITGNAPDQCSGC